jgi:hypothetical protein
MAFRVLGAAALSLAPGALAYDEIDGYMPVSDVQEQGQIIDDVTLMFAAMSFNSLEAGAVYAGAECIYENGGGQSCKSASTPRVLQGFATKDLTGETYADKFYASGYAVDFWDEFLTAALHGTGDFDGLSDTKRVTSIKKGVMGLVTYYASHELEAAIDKAAVASTRSDSKSGHAWDEGWAFYRGLNSDDQDTPFEVAVKRDSDFPDGTTVSTAIVPYFNAGLIAVRSDTYDATSAEYARDTIYKMWAITYLRAALKYLELMEASYDEKAHAEGYAYWNAIDGWWGQYDSASAASMRNALAITKTEIASGTFCDTKALMEAAYPTVGIDCDMVGTYKYSTIDCTNSARRLVGTTIVPDERNLAAETTIDPDGGSSTDSCGAATVTFQAGSSMVAAVSGTWADDVTCAPAACEDDDSSTVAAVSSTVAAVSSTVAAVSGTTAADVTCAPAPCGEEASGARAAGAALAGAAALVAVAF